jgi:hypothetical protein
MKNLINSIKNASASAKVLVAGSALTASSSLFASGMTAPTFNTTDFVTVGTALIGAYAAIWGVKRIIGLVAR